MEGKLFTLDKNFILKEVQLKSKDALLADLVHRVKRTYVKEHNPLGLVDQTIETINRCKVPDFEYLENFYFELAGIYRFKYGENQLTFLFDGDSHFDKYAKDWERAFHRWIRKFMKHQHFIRAILEGSILNPTTEGKQHVCVRLKLFLEQFFNLRVYKYKGIRKIMVA